MQTEVQNPMTDKNSREQLLDALDAEINAIVSTQAATGRTRWALLLSLAGLLWLGLQIWEKGDFMMPLVALLAIAMTVLWDFILNLRTALDMPLIPNQVFRGRFLLLGNFLGALRSTILFHAAKHALVLIALIWIASPEVIILKWYTIVSLSAVLLGFAISFVDFPPFPFVDVQSRLHGFRLALPCIVWLARVTATGSAVYILFRDAKWFTGADIRYALVLTAIAYLLTVLIEDQFPTNHLSALRTIRQNLSFSRISPGEARDQIDLLLFGGDIVQAFQRPVDTILALTERSRSLMSQVEDLLSQHEKLKSQLSQFSGQSELHAEKRAEYDRHYKFIVQLYNQADAQQKILLKRLKTFDEHVRFIAFISPSLAREAAPVIEKLRLAIQPLANQQQKIKTALFQTA